MNDKEKIKRYDLLDCIELVEKCPHCGNNIRVSLTNFKTVSFKFGLAWACPGCHADFHIKKSNLRNINNAEHLYCFG